ncbi:MAG: segregation/condensation protein A [Ruminococcus sp.]|nr:segregation/condensation protein A [Ruminococcus sp.]
MEAVTFKLDAFEGPLDLLLHLVTKHKLNIYDIEISLLLEQYLAYIEELDVKDYEQAADFLEMAARLIYIKTCYLLPQPEEAEELKKELQGRIIEYSLCKLAAQRLREDYAGGTVFVRVPVKLPVNKQYTRLHDKQELLEAYLAISSKVKEYKPLRANIFSPIVSHRIVSVESKIEEILSRLITVGHFSMSSLYDGMSDRSERIAAFLAVLELTKSGKIFLNDDNTQIELRRTVDEDEESVSESAEPENEADDTESIEPVLPDEPEAADDTAEIPEEPEAADDTADVPDMSVDEQDTVTEPVTVDDTPVEPAEAEVSEPETSAEPVNEPNPVVEPETEPVSEAAEPENVVSESDTQTKTPVEAIIRDEPAVTVSEPEPVLPAEDKPAKAHSVRFALATYTVRLNEKTEAVPAFAPMPEKESVPEPAEEVVLPAADMSEEPHRQFKANYFGRRYFWGSVPSALGERSYAVAGRLRI